jgi:segregation and condensation protein A
VRTTPTRWPDSARRRPRRRRRRRAAAGAQRAERTRHDEKITVYISADELLALESARLTLRGPARRGRRPRRIVREAINVLLADLAERGEDSVLRPARRSSQTRGHRDRPHGGDHVPTSRQEPASARRDALGCDGDGAPGGRQRAVHRPAANFEGPFDLLLQLIGKHQLDVTEIALSTVTDEFIAHLRALGDELDLDQASEFLVVAATLLDLKAARLLPAAEVEDDEDLELLEARDLLFARLLQYRAYKQAAAFLREREAGAVRRHPATWRWSPRFADLLPEVLLGVTPSSSPPWPPGADPAGAADGERLPPARAAGQRRRAAPAGAQPAPRAGTASFRALTADCGHTLEVVARFLALLELYRQQRVSSSS